MKTLVALMFLVAVSLASAQGITSWDVKNNNIESLSLPDTRKLLGKVVGLKGGDSFRTVTNLLGKPDVDYPSGSPTVTHRVLEYYLFRRKGATTGDPSTKFVRVVLDSKKQQVHVVEINARFQ